MKLLDDQATGMVGGRPWPRPAPNWRRPTAWYLFHLAMAIVGMTSVTIGLGGEIRMRMGLAGSGALDHEGLWMFVFSMSWGYWFRLIFWGRVPPNYQNIARTVQTLLAAAELPLAAVTVFLVATQGPIQFPNDPAFRVSPLVVYLFTTLGTLCQISTVIWLLRYRKE